MSPISPIDLDPSIEQMHSTNTATRASSRDGAVLVVGVSHSGADIAFEAANAPTLLAGHAHGQLPIKVIDTWRAMIVWPVVVFVASHVLTMRTPMGRRMAPRAEGRRPAHCGSAAATWTAAGVERHDAKTVGVHDGRPRSPTAPCSTLRT